MRRRRLAYSWPRTCTIGGVALALGLLLARSADAASLQKVNQSDWWAGASGLPSYVNMYTYVPAQLATKPPLVVAPHHCQGTAQSTFSEMSTLVSIADKTGFILIFPEATGENCWDAGSTRSLSHGGGGDTGAVVQMVKYTLSKYGADAARVYSVGGSSGGIMTEALLGVYPDVFMGGVSLMGVPCGCWAEGYNDVTGSGSTAQWSGACADGTVTKTGQAWGALVRSYYAGYTGHRPRLQHWHGTADTTLNFKNLAEDVKEWTNLLGLSETPTGSDTPKSGTTHQFWKNACGYTVYETFALSGVAHAVPFDGNAVAAYFGLDGASTADPETAACSSGTGGMGAGGSGVGGSGLGGMAGAGVAGIGPNGGRAGDGTGGPAGASGANNAGGASSGGAGAGMGRDAGGAAAVAGGFGGKPAGSDGGRATTGGQSQAGFAAAIGGAASGQSGVGGAPSRGGSTQSGDTAGGAKPASGADASGCRCVASGTAGGVSHAAAALAFAALAAARSRRRRLRRA